MAKLLIADIQPNQEVAAPFLVASKQLRTARNGNPFLTLKLADRSGEITGRMWERATEAAAGIATKDVVFVRGHSETFRDELQLQIKELTPVPRAEVDPADYLPVAAIDTALLTARLRKLAGAVRRPALKRLLEHILSDRPFMARFKRAPAAKSMHHAYLGGLLEHSVSVGELVVHICDHYPQLDRDLLIAGSILHDVGKIDEYEYELHIDYSDVGRLLGHMTLGVEILEWAVRALGDLPAEDVTLLKHLILSHHGEEQFGAVKLPMTPEAMVLHFADDLDAKMNFLTRLLAEQGGEAQSWTSYQPLFGRYFFRGFGSAEKAEDGAPGGSATAGNGQLSLWSMTGKNRADDES